MSTSTWECVTLIACSLAVLGIIIRGGLDRWFDGRAANVRQYIDALNEANAKVMGQRHTIDTLKRENDQLKQELAKRPTQRQVQVLESLL